MPDPQARLLALRLRFRRNAEARALVDRCLVLVSWATEAEADMAALDWEVTRLADDLALRFGAPARPKVHLRKASYFWSARSPCSARLLKSSAR
jgi:hypothetical protein